MVNDNPEQSDLCLVRMARWLTAVTCGSPAYRGWLLNDEDEVLSEAYVAVVRANDAYPGQVCCRAWPPAVAEYARGLLVGALRRDGFLPYAGGDLQRPRTNWDFDGEARRERDRR